MCIGLRLIDVGRSAYTWNKIKTRDLQLRFSVVSWLSSASALAPSSPSVLAVCVCVCVCVYWIGLMLGGVHTPTAKVKCCELVELSKRLGSFIIKVIICVDWV